MANNPLALFDLPKNQLPTHVADFLGEESNIVDRVTVPSLGYEGKVWQIALNGEKTKLMKRDAEGDEVPVSIFRAVVLDYAKRRGRAFYEGNYDPAKASAPLCWSEDGVVPDESVEAKQHHKCDGCPMAVKGSKVTDANKQVAACSQHRMLVVVPATKLDFEPLRLKIAVTSDWDKNSPEEEAKGWFAFNNYTDMLRSKGVQHTAALVTKIKFDQSVAYPKLLFSPDRWLEAAEIAVIKPVINSDKVKNLVSGTWTPAGVDGVAIAGPKKAPADPAPVKQRPAPAAVEADEDDMPEVVVPKTTKKAPVTIEHDETEVPATKPPKAAKAAPKAAPPPAPEPDEDEDDEEAALQAQLAAARKKKADRAAALAAAADAVVTKATPAPVVDTDEDEEGEAAVVLPPVKGKGTKATPAPAVQQEVKKAAPATGGATAPVPNDVAALLDEWGE